MGQNGAHLKFKVKQGKASFDVVAFNKGDLLQEFQQAQGLELAVTLICKCLEWSDNTPAYA